MSRWNPKVKTIDALERGLIVLDEVRATQGASLQELHARTGYAKATLLRILATLQLRGLIWRRIADDYFCPASTLNEPSRRARVLDLLGQCAAPGTGPAAGGGAVALRLTVRARSAMIVRETNRSQSYFTIRRDNIGFQINMLRSAVGRAYLAFCAEKERDSILLALRRSRREGDALANDCAAVAKLLEQTRRQGYGLREQRFGGDYDRDAQGSERQAGGDCRSHHGRARAALRLRQHRVDPGSAFGRPDGGAIPGTVEARRGTIAASMIRRG